MADIPYNILVQRVRQLEQELARREQGGDYWNRRMAEEAARAEKAEAEVERLTKIIELYRAHRCPDPIEEGLDLRAEVERLRADAQKWREKFKEVTGEAVDWQIKVKDLHESLRAERAEVERLRETIARVAEWTQQYGEALCPQGADTYGDGVRESKKRVRLILATGWTHDGNNWSQDQPKQEDDDGN